MFCLTIKTRFTFVPFTDTVQSIFSKTNLVQMEAEEVQIYLNPWENPVLKFSFHLLAIFQPGFTIHEA